MTPRFARSNACCATPSHTSGRVPTRPTAGPGRSSELVPTAAVDLGFDQARVIARIQERPSQRRTVRFA